jgi:hypothetical protein
MGIGYPVDIGNRATHVPRDEDGAGKKKAYFPGPKYPSLDALPNINLDFPVSDRTITINKNGEFIFLICRDKNRDKHSLP